MMTMMMMMMMAVLGLRLH